MKVSPRFRLPEVILIVLMLFSGIMLGFSSGGFVINFHRVGFSVLSIVQRGVYAVTGVFTGTFTAIRDMRNLRKEYQELTEKLKNYEYLQRNNADIRRENARLREQLDFATGLEYRNIAAQIIGRDPDSLYSSITINKGSRSGVKKGMPVVAIQNGNVGVVGKVVTVGLLSSQVMPVYDLKCNISARVQNSRDLGIVSGNGYQDAELSMKYIRKRALDELHYGDVVVTSGENDNYMRDVPIGTISKIAILDYDTALDIDLHPMIDFSRLENVLVVDQGYANDRPADFTEARYD